MLFLQGIPPNAFMICVLSVTLQECTVSVFVKVQTPFDEQRLHMPMYLSPIQASVWGGVGNLSAELFHAYCIRF